MWREARWGGKRDTPCFLLSSTRAVLQYAKDRANTSARKKGDRKEKKQPKVLLCPTQYSHFFDPGITFSQITMNIQQKSWAHQCVGYASLSDSVFNKII